MYVYAALIIHEKLLMERLKEATQTLAFPLLLFCFYFSSHEAKCELHYEETEKIKSSKPENGCYTSQAINFQHTLHILDIFLRSN